MSTEQEPLQEPLYENSYSLRPNNALHRCGQAAPVYNGPKNLDSESG